MLPATHVVACLAGNGIGPEVVAEASRALAAVARLHGFRIEERHPPFGAEALFRSGSHLPASTRDAVLGADAVLVAGLRAPALDGVRAELDLQARVSRVRSAATGADVTVFAPLADAQPDFAIDRALLAACARRGRLQSVGVDRDWRARVDARAERHPGVEVEHLALADALQRLAFEPQQLDVLVTEHVLAEALPLAPRHVPGSRPLRAGGLLAPGGPGLFGPFHGPAADIAGQGVANPSEMLLAAALMLGEGLYRRAAAETLEGGVGAAHDARVRTPDMASAGSPGATTREFADAVLALLPGARRDLEVAL